MRESGVTEQDWQLFRNRLPQWQEVYMEKLNSEYAAILMADGKASEKFWTLEQRLRKDKRSAGVSVDMRRSKMLWNLMALLGEGVISRGDLDGFSDETMEALNFFLQQRNAQETE